MRDPLARWTSIGIVAGTLILVANLGPDLVRAAIQTPQDGVERLRSKLGSFAPTGKGITMLQVEAAGDGPGEWTLGPIEGRPELVVQPVGPRSAPAAHAGMVAQAMLSVAPGLERIYTGSSAWFLREVIRVGQADPPRPLPAGTRVVLCAWVGSSGPADVDILRRADFMVIQSPFTLVAGTKGSSHLMGSAYNAIAVGGADAAPNQGTAADLDGPGRCKPDLVTAEGAASPATGRVAGAVALLLDATDRIPRLRRSVEARRPEVLKAALLAGAVREPEWTNLVVDPASPPLRSTAQPLDRAVGAGRLDVARAFDVLGAGAQAWTAEGAAVEDRGWTTLAWRGADGGEQREASCRIALEEDAGELAVVACWNRVIIDAQTWSLSDVDLRIERLDGGAVDSSSSWATSGNVASESRIDNVEMILLRNVRAGEYRIVARLREGAPVAVAVGWLVSGPSARRPEPARGG